MVNSGRIELTRGLSPAGAFPTDEIVSCAEAALRAHGKTLLQYHPAVEFAPLRELLAGAAGASPDEVIVGNGSIQVLGLLAQVVLSSGDTVLVERPSYGRAITTFRCAGPPCAGCRWRRTASTSRPSKPW